MRPISFAAALDKFRPEFNQRTELRRTLAELLQDSSRRELLQNNHTYFATIPRDINNIILEFLPDLRQTFTDKQFADAETQYREFIHKYDMTNGDHPPVCRYIDPFIRDFNLSPDDLNDVYVKNINGTKAFAQKDIVYAGQTIDTTQQINFWYDAGDNTIRQTSNERPDPANDIDIFKFYNIAYNDWVQIWVLPCKLLLIKTTVWHSAKSDDAKYYLVDTLLKQAQPIEFTDSHILKLIDDYGQIIMPKCTQNALRFSELSAAPLYLLF